jgi:hypothetical protein
MLHRRMSRTGSFDLVTGEPPPQHASLIPDRFRFPRMKHYIRSIPWEGYLNDSFVSESMVPHFTEALAIISSKLAELERVTAELTPKSPIAKPSSPVEINFLNSQIAHRYKAFLPIFDGIDHHLHFLEQSLLTQVQTQLSGLKRVCEYLQANPVCVYINLELVSQDISGMLFDFIPRIYRQYYAFKFRLMDLKTELDFTPVPFATNDQIARFLNQVLSAPVSYGLPSKSSDAFDDLIQSRPDLFSISDVNQSNLPTVVKRIVSVCTDLAKVSESETLTVFTTRSVFRVSGLIETAVLNFTREIDGKLSEKKLSDFNVPQKLDLSISEFAEKLREAIDDLLSIILLTNPLDQAFFVREADAKLKSVFGAQEGVKAEEVIEMWKVLLIAARLPKCGAFLAFVESWMGLPFVRAEFRESVAAAGSAVKGLTRDE